MTNFFHPFEKSSLYFIFRFIKRIDAFDMHTQKGRREGKGIDHFFAEGAKIKNQNKEVYDPYEELAKEAWKASGKSEREDTQETEGVRKKSK